MSFLLVDRILELIPSKSAKGEKYISRDEAYLYHNSEDVLCFIPSLIGEALGQLAAWNVMQANNFVARPVAGIVERACMYRDVYVEETLSLEIFIDRLDETAVEYHGVAKVDLEIVFSIDGALGPLLPMADFIFEKEVRAQFLAITGEQVKEDKKILAFNSESSSQIKSLLLFDSISIVEPGVLLRAEKHIKASSCYFTDHFPNNPVMPMTVLLECKLNLAREFLARFACEIPYKISELSRIKMNNFVRPGEQLICHMHIKHQDTQKLIINYISEVNGKRVCIVTLVMKAVYAL